MSGRRSSYYHAVLGCEAIINGPLTSNEGLPPRLSILDTNETHPAVVRCQVTCFNHSGVYNPAMALIITSEEQFISVPAGNISSRDAYGLYEIFFSGISSCEAHNNYTMEFEYLIYSNSFKIDRAVLQCGVIHPFTNPPCWGQSYGIIRYDTELVYITPTLTTTNVSSSATLPATESQTTTTNMCSSSPPVMVTNGLSQEQSGLASSIAILAVTVIIETVLLILLLMYIYFTRPLRRIRKVQPLQQSLVMKTVHANEKAAEQANTFSSTQTNKLEDMISSRDTCSKYVIKY